MRLFPAKATDPQGQAHEPVVVFETGPRTRIVAHEGGRPVVLVDVDSAMERRSIDGTRNTRLVVATADGEWSVGNGRGCGCGHPLKRLGVRQVDALQEAAAG